MIKGSEPGQGPGRESRQCLPVRVRTQTCGHVCQGIGGAVGMNALRRWEIILKRPGEG